MILHFRSNFSNEILGKRGEEGGIFPIFFLQKYFPIEACVLRFFYEFMNPENVKMNEVGKYDKSWGK